MGRLSRSVEDRVRACKGEEEKASDDDDDVVS